MVGMHFVCVAFAPTNYVLFTVFQLETWWCILYNVVGICIIWNYA